MSPYANSQLIRVLEQGFAKVAGAIEVGLQAIAEAQKQERPVRVVQRGERGGPR